MLWRNNLLNLKIRNLELQSCFDDYSRIAIGWRVIFFRVWSHKCETLKIWRRSWRRSWSDWWQSNQSKSFKFWKFRLVRTFCEMLFQLAFFPVPPPAAPRFPPCNTPRFSRLFRGGIAGYWFLIHMQVNGVVRLLNWTYPCGVIRLGKHSALVPIGPSSPRAALRAHKPSLWHVSSLINFLFQTTNAGSLAILSIPNLNYLTITTWWYGSYYSKNRSNRQTYIDYIDRRREAIIRAFLE